MNRTARVLAVLRRAIAAPVDLITNGDFSTNANFTFTHSGGTHNATISGGVLAFSADTDSNQQFATQTLAGGSSPSGTYRVTCDTVSLGSNDLQVTLLGAANETRGTGNPAGSAGVGKTFTITATGEVSKVMIRGVVNGSVDNFKLLRTGS